MYEKIEKWYRMGLWTADMVRWALEKAVLAPEEAEKILKEGRP